jgi:hypothetical protein
VVHPNWSRFRPAVEILQELAEILLSLGTELWLYNRNDDRMSQGCSRKLFGPGFASPGIIKEDDGSDPWSAL